MAISNFPYRLQVVRGGGHTIVMTLDEGESMRAYRERRPASRLLAALCAVCAIPCAEASHGSSSDFDADRGERGRGVAGGVGSGGGRDGGEAAELCPPSVGLWPRPASCSRSGAGQGVDVAIPVDVAVDLPRGFPADIGTAAINRLGAALATTFTHAQRGPIEPHLQHGRSGARAAREANRGATGVSVTSSTIQGSGPVNATRPNVRPSSPTDNPREGAVATTIRVSVNSLPPAGGPPAVKGLDANESYTLTVDAPVIAVSAAEVWGVIYAFETLAQLCEFANGTVTGSATERGVGATTHPVVRACPVRVSDAPRFPWRGVLLDTANHFFPVDVLLRTVDALAQQKMNVFHWHMVDSYSFPFASQAYPELAAKGAWHPTTVYTHDSVRRVVEHARLRGVRVVPELDFPGHAYSFGLAYPNLTVPCDGVHIDTDIGPVNIVPLNPATNFTYRVLDALLSEFNALFPDAFLHVGGDEFELACWNASADVAAYARRRNRTLRELHEDFETRMLGVVRGAHPSPRRPVLWEDSFEAIPGAIGRDAVVEVWSDGTLLAKAMDAGHDAILALGWYLDRQVPVDNATGWFWLDTWAQMYTLDLPDHAPGGKAGRLLGGEANMWTEQVSPLSLDARVWPRACAVAERLWSPASVNDTGDAATRLARHRCRMAASGVRVGPIWADYCSADYPTPVQRSSTPGGNPRSTAPADATSGVAVAAAAVFGSVGLGRLPAFTYGSIAIATIVIIAASLWLWLWRTERARRAADADAHGHGDDDSALVNIQSSSGDGPEAKLLLPGATIGASGRRGGGGGKGVPIKQRVQSLDVFRGFNIALMIFVDMVGSSFPSIHHSPWDGVRLADFVMPFFDFMVGVSLAISLKRVQDVTADGRVGFRRAAFVKATVRFVKIFVIGVLTQGGISPIDFNLEKIRIMGILQRVAVCYYAVALMEIFLPRATQFDVAGARSVLGKTSALLARYRWHWVAAALLVAANTAIMYGVDVTASDGTRCGRGVLTPKCNAASYVDRLVFGVDHMYFPTNGGGNGKDMTFQRMPECSGCSPGKCPKPDAPEWCNHTPFDPEGIVSSFNAIVTTAIGAHCGHVLVLLKSHDNRLTQWNIAGWLQLAVGLILHFTGAIAMNTDLYSISYLLVSGAAACLVLAGFYFSVDVLGTKAMAPFQYFGMNAILMYLLAEGGIPDTILSMFWWGNPGNSAQAVLWPTGDFWGDSDDELPSEPTRSPYIMVWTIVYICLWMVVAWGLHLRGVYVKI